jgi:uncharacterized protein YqjF (DUF2071 family)
MIGASDSTLPPGIDWTAAVPSRSGLLAEKGIEKCDTHKCIVTAAAGDSRGPVHSPAGLSRRFESPYVVSFESKAARERILSIRGEPLLIADWGKVLMIHYEVNAAALQRVTPFELDLCDGRAFVSVVAFTLCGMRPYFGGRLAAWLMKPIATHEFLNVRTYVRKGNESGIYFMTEWLSNRLSVALGPIFFGLPYRHGRIQYEGLTGAVRDSSGAGDFSYSGTFEGNGSALHCEGGTLAEWLMERYTAFTYFRGVRRFFRVWHVPWEQRAVNVFIRDQSLLEGRWPFMRKATIIGANYSPGARNVWMGRPHRCGLS